MFLLVYTLLCRLLVSCLYFSQISFFSMRSNSLSLSLSLSLLAKQRSDRATEVLLWQAAGSQEGLEERCRTTYLLQVKEIPHERYWHNPPSLSSPRLHVPDPPNRINHLLRRGSRFRYSGRTLRQTMDGQARKQQHDFQRSEFKPHPL